jgi:UDP-glucose 4-epimerase
MNVLVTGGAGYIGSHAVRKLTDCGHRAVVLDNLSHGHASAVRAANSEAAFIHASMADSKVVADTVAQHKIEAVMHFAAFIEVAESVKDPCRYYKNNFVRALAFIDTLRNCGIKKIIFSSTAAVYGQPKLSPVTEQAERNPINPYGRSKMMVEMALEDYSRAYGISYTILRYFNVAGAHPDATLGEAHQPESHLIPRILQSAAESGFELEIYGCDYQTHDGTCVRDYIHVDDLVAAHVLALESMKEGDQRIYNLGSEKGFSVFEVLRACEKILGQSISYKKHGRREGDPAVLVASSQKIKQELGWNPRFTNLETIVAHAWQWQQKRFQTAN